MKKFIRYSIVFLILGIFFLIFTSNFVLPLITKKNNVLYLPDVRNKNIFNAERILNELGFSISIIKSSFNENFMPNTVITTNPRAFTKVKKGRNIILKISGDKDDINIPDYINTSLRNTIINIDRIRLNIDTLIFEYSNTIKKDYIIDQYPKKNKVLKTNDEITLVVSLGVPPDYYIVPNLVNINLKIAKEIISKSGLLLGNIKYEFNNDFLNNTILEQNLTPEMKYSFPALIDLIVSTDKIKLNE